MARDVNVTLTAEQIRALADESQKYEADGSDGSCSIIAVADSEDVVQVEFGEQIWDSPTQPWLDASGNWLDSARDGSGPEKQSEAFDASSIEADPMQFQRHETQRRESIPSSRRGDIQLD